MAELRRIVTGTGWEQQRLTQRTCRVCEWEAMVIEDRDADVDCPWCHGPTEAVMLAPVMAMQPADAGKQKKNPMAAALGRLGGLKGGRARAQVLTPKQRRPIARNAARARWRKSSR